MKQQAMKSGMFYWYINMKYVDDIVDKQKIHLVVLSVNMSELSACEHTVEF